MALGDPIKGKALRLRFNDKLLYHATECVLDMSRDTEETTSKDTNGKLIALGDYTYTLSTAALYAMLPAGDTTHIDADTLNAAFLAGTSIDWQFFSAGDSLKMYSGTVYVTSANLTATNGSNSNTSYTFTGSGDIAIEDVD
jgi:hypothetical protein